MRGRGDYALSEGVMAPKRDVLAPKRGEQTSKSRVKKEGVRGLCYNERCTAIKRRRRSNKNAWTSIHALEQAEKCPKNQHQNTLDRRKRFPSADRRSKPGTNPSFHPPTKLPVRTTHSQNPLTAHCAHARNFVWVKKVSCHLNFVEWGVHDW